ncbi:hypothetical protein N752_08945 [Desulforamulus aquiferis]|nr:hypothetical protein N752_08945 [Desulforamulus aquiferis]
MTKKDSNYFVDIRVKLNGIKYQKLTSFPALALYNIARVLLFWPYWYK